MTAYSEVGSVLRTAREKAGRSVSELASETGLPERYIQALEQGDMAVLPDLSYARLYCQSYARALKLDTLEVMQSWPGTTKVEATLPPPAATTSGSRRLWPWIGAALAVGVGAFLWVPRGGELPSDRTSELPAVSRVDTQFNMAHIQQEPVPSESDGGQDSTPASSVPEPGVRMILEVTATEQSWVVIEADGDTVEARVLVQDQSLRAEADTEFRLTATNSRGLKVLLDGEAVPLGARTDRPLIRHRIGKDSS